MKTRTFFRNGVALLAIAATMVACGDKNNESANNTENQENSKVESASSLRYAQHSRRDEHCHRRGPDSRSRAGRFGMEKYSQSEDLTRGFGLSQSGDEREQYPEHRTEKRAIGWKRAAPLLRRRTPGSRCAPLAEHRGKRKERRLPGA